MSVPSYDGAAAATSILMSKQMRELAILFVEGVCEVRLLIHHFPTFESQIVPCKGHLGVKDAIAIVNQWEENNGESLLVLGFVDKDYGAYKRTTRITSTVSRDLEIDLFTTGAGERLLKEKASSTKCSNPRGTIDDALQELTFVGLIRKYNSEKGLGWSINHIDIDKFANQHGQIDSERFLSLIAQKNGLSQAQVSDLRNYITCSGTVPPSTVVRGHDLSALLGKWLRKKIGSRQKAETEWTIVEENLRLATAIEELRKLHWGRRIESHLKSEH